jgi:hypothetical protein
VKWLGEFLQRCANQFAFARVARIVHANLSPSNLSFDGRWVDLTNASFIEGGVNRGGRPPFYEEPLAVLRYLVEFADTFGKYNGIELNSRPLIDYYIQQFEGYSDYWISTLVGISPKLVSNCLGKPEYTSLARQVTLVLQSGKHVVNSWSDAIAPSDPVIHLQSSLFGSLYHRAEAIDQLNALRSLDVRFLAEQTADAFKSVVSIAFQNAANNLGSFDSFVTYCAIEALRRSLFAEYFYKGRLMKRVRKVLDTNPLDSRALIDDSSRVASWIFGAPKLSTSILFRGNARALSFNALSGEFIDTCEQTGAKSVHQSAKSLIASIQASGPADFVVQGYDFRPNMLILLRTLASLTTRSVN